MVIVDANVLLYAVNEDTIHHRAARTWLDDALAANSGVGFAWLVLVAFMRVSTNTRIMPTPLSVDEAIEQVEAWLACPAAVVVDPTPRHLRVWADVMRGTHGGGDLVNDAHLAALALENRATVVSFDRDFQRFDGVRLLVPPPVSD
jgi:toxin-antitoxin system PIN domain toxin